MVICTGGDFGGSKNGSILRRAGKESRFSNPISQFPLGANVHPPKRKTTTPTSPIRSTSPVATHRMCQNGGHVFYLWSLFWICAFLPLLGSCEGKTQKRQVAGEILNKWRQLSPHPPSTQITSTHLHTLPAPTLTLILGPHDGVVVRDDANVPIF